MRVLERGALLWTIGAVVLALFGIDARFSLGVAMACLLVDHIVKAIEGLRRKDKP